MTIQLNRRTVSLIQAELAKTFSLKKQDDSQYSYAAFAAEITEFWEQDMPAEIKELIPHNVLGKDLLLSAPGLKTDNLRKFVVGDSKSMKRERLVASLCWLISGNSFSGLSITDIDSSARVTQSKMIGIFDAHLFQHAVHEPYINRACFFPQYQESSQTSWICFGESVNKHTVELQYYETHADSLHVYNGHLVIGPDDTGYAFLKSATCGDTKMFAFIPLREDVLNGLRLERFSLVEIGSSACAFEDEPKLTVSMYTVSEAGWKTYLETAPIERLAI